MAKFDFHIDRKVTIWSESRFSVEAETEEEAIAIAKTLLEDGADDVSETDDSRISYDESEFLFDTEEHPTVSENGGCATLELYLQSEPYDCIAKNAEDPII